MNLIDLHTHTNYSDGTATAEQTLMLAERLGLSFLSITDHNTVNAYDELLQKKHLFSGRLVSGVHWLSDIVGGMLVSAGLVMIYHALCNVKEKNMQLKHVPIFC